MEKLIEALQKLDKANDNHWTSDGLPKVDTVRFLAGDQTITREQISAAAPNFNRNSEDAPAPVATEVPDHAAKVQGLEAEIAGLDAEEAKLNAKMAEIEADRALLRKHRDELITALEVERPKITQAQLLRMQEESLAKAREAAASAKKV